MKKTFLKHEHFQQLLDALKEAGFACIGPQVRDGAIIYDTLTTSTQLPWGLRDFQEPGSYRLEKTAEYKAFSWANGPQALKPYLFKAEETLWRVKRDEAGKFIFEAEYAKAPAIAFIGARACDLAALAIQDKVFIEAKQIDIRYQQRRESLLIIAVNCTYASKNCFCVSAGTGPKVNHAYDLVLTEVDQGFVVQSGSERGAAILAKLTLTPASLLQIQQGALEIQQAANMQSKKIPFNNTRALGLALMNKLDHPRWLDVAERCLSCGNCTLVCPTCFCHSERDKPSLEATSSEHVREWDSCFTKGHSYITGKVIRPDTQSRYRQWLTHKVATWFEQFDVSGCVGCGRCITWCPVGIDLTEELSAMVEDFHET